MKLKFAVFSMTLMMGSATFASPGTAIRELGDSIRKGCLSEACISAKATARLAADEVEKILLNKINFLKDYSLNGKNPALSGIQTSDHSYKHGKRHIESSKASKVGLDRNSSIFRGDSIADMTKNISTFDLNEVGIINHITTSTYNSLRQTSTYNSLRQTSTRESFAEVGSQTEKAMQLHFYYTEKVQRIESFIAKIIKSPEVSEQQVLDLIAFIQAKPISLFAKTDGDFDKFREMMSAMVKKLKSPDASFSSEGIKRESYELLSRELAFGEQYEPVFKQLVDDIAEYAAGRLGYDIIAKLALLLRETKARAIQREISLSFEQSPLHAIITTQKYVDLAKAVDRTDQFEMVELVEFLEGSIQKAINKVLRANPEDFARYGQNSALMEEAVIAFTKATEGKSDAAGAIVNLVLKTDSAHIFNNPQLNLLIEANPALKSKVEELLSL